MEDLIDVLLREAGTLNWLQVPFTSTDESLKHDERPWWWLTRRAQYSWTTYETQLGKKYDIQVRKGTPASTKNLPTKYSLSIDHTDDQGAILYSTTDSRLGALYDIIDRAWLADAEALRRLNELPVKKDVDSVVALLQSERHR